MISRTLAEICWSTASLPSGKAVSVLAVWQNGKEIEVYHVITQVAFHRYDCWDVINGEFVTIQLI